MNPALFYSLESPGGVTNRYGVVLRGARILDREERGRILREALAAGWKLTDHSQGDHGRTWLPPASE